MRLLLITYFFSFVALSFAQEKDSLYKKGIEALSVKDYNAAQDYFTQNIEIAPSFESYYNLGYAYAKKEKWNKSLWANEAALKYDPTNSKAIYNAKFSLKQISPDAFWSHPYSWTKRIILSIGETTWFILMLISSIIVAVSIYFLLSQRNGCSKKVWSKRLIFPFLTLLVLAVYCFNEALNHYEENKYAYSLGVEAQLYLSPDGLEVDGELPKNVRLNVIQNQKEWIQIATPDLRTYWLKKEDLFMY
jgi:tetratricopeptide (TPR) repeat protein